MSAGRSALVFGDIQTDSQGAEAVHGVVRWLYAPLRLLSSISNGILQKQLPDEHYNRGEAVHRAQVFREIKTVPHYTCGTWGIRTQTRTHRHLLDSLFELSSKFFLDSLE